MFNEENKGDEMDVVRVEQYIPYYALPQNYISFQSCMLLFEHGSVANT